MCFFLIEFFALLAEILLKYLLTILKNLICIVSFSEHLFFSLVPLVELFLLQSLLLNYFLDLVIDALKPVVNI